ncbi:cytosolic arginine sensor for mTORC1 subunit 2 isoform X2 [Leptonychotes weddellii]|uniref:Cytosolic arginine sensor for mTORC1 subunit 2 isoform X2 n=1 Tax=Leptonychotes weddellii TaxID=9713 RepID=A0A7F8RQ40_LEPWE|nr:cytosolic arginine sensor for mTORC1 subunit 2 isoform X2 [Leptonychotes weddellii]
MELHILEHRLQVASVAKESIPLFTYGLIKLAFLSSKTSRDNDHAYYLASCEDFIRTALPLSLIHYKLQLVFAEDESWFSWPVPGPSLKSPRLGDFSILSDSNKGRFFFCPPGTLPGDTGHLGPRQ